MFSQNVINGNTDISYVARLNAVVLVRKTYSIKYMLNDGTDVVYTTFSGKYYGDPITLPPVRRAEAATRSSAGAAARRHSIRYRIPTR